MAPAGQQQGDGVIRRGAARWLMVSAAAVVTGGCAVGGASVPVDRAAPAAEIPVAVESATADSANVTRLVLAAASSTTLPELPAAEVPSGPASEMVIVLTTTAPPAPVVARRVVAASTTPAVAPPPSTTAPPPPPAPGVSAVRFDASAAADFVARTNALRASLGLSPLARNGELEGYAASWARALSVAGKLSHSTSPERAISTGWMTAGENVGTGGSVGPVHKAFVASPGHYANLVKPSYTGIGVAVVFDADGRLWVCEVFAG